MNWGGQLVECQKALTKLEEAARAGKIDDVLPHAQQLANKADTLLLTLRVAQMQGAR
jgi:hypothetical protein